MSKSSANTTSPTMNRVLRVRFELAMSNERMNVTNGEAIELWARKHFRDVYIVDEAR